MDVLQSTDAGAGCTAGQQDDHQKTSSLIDFLSAPVQKYFHPVLTIWIFI
jgi:hypothetical protein